jgi:stearoyl-CoA desaturase (delta-9 desaturase)
MGLFPGQIDLGWWLIKTFEAARLATNIKTPDDLAPRDGLRGLTTTACIGHQAELRLP